MPDLARSFGGAAAAYERGRPGYAEAALDAVGLSASAVVLDLAAGTGKLTRQLARVLRPRGTLAILFNQADGDFEPPLPEAFWAAYRAAAVEKPPEQTVGTGLWQAPFPGPFEPLAASSFPNPVELDRAGILAQAASWSMVGALPEAERSALLVRLAQLLPEGAYRHPLRTDLHLTRLR